MRTITKQISKNWDNANHEKRIHTCGFHYYSDEKKRGFRDGPLTPGCPDPQKQVVIIKPLQKLDFEKI